MRRYFGGFALLVACLAGCGASNDSQAVSASKPDLHFSPAIVQIALPSGVTLGVNQGSFIRLPCEADAINVKYTYKNSGPVLAKPHSITGSISGLSTGSGQGVGVLASGASRTLVMTVSLAELAGNQVRTFRLNLDSSGVINESNEFNNSFAVRVIKQCL